MAADLAAATLSLADISVVFVLSPDAAGIDAVLEVFLPVDGAIGAEQFLKKGKHLCQQWDHKSQLNFDIGGDLLEI